MHNRTTIKILVIKQLGAEILAIFKMNNCRRGEHSFISNSTLKTVRMSSDYAPRNTLPIIIIADVVTNPQIAVACQIG